MPALWLLTLMVAGPVADDRPNVLVLFTDDQRADTIAALGNPAIKTPNLDRLARRGVSFDRAYVQGGLQPATCAPSRAMLLSGRPLFRIDEHLKRDPTWPGAFGQAGYETFLTGKWHNDRTSIPVNFQRAESVFTGGMTNPLHAPLSDLADGALRPPKRAPKHACAVFADRVIAFLREPRDRPFFCYVPFDGPHDPHVVPKNFAITHDSSLIPVPPNFLPQHPFNNGEMLIRDERLLPWPRTREAVKKMNAEYYRYISYLDMQIGRILDVLDSTSAASNTIIAFTSDSGVARGGHGLIGKQNLYEESIRVPLVICGPGIPEGRRSNAMCYLIDLLPTIGAMCGVTAPSTSEGISFASSLTDPERPAREHLMFAYRDVQRGYRNDRWKLIRYPKVNKTQLFDLNADPYELNDLAGRSEFAGRTAILIDDLQHEMTRLGDRCRLTVAHPEPAEWSPPTNR